MSLAPKISNVAPLKRIWFVSFPRERGRCPLRVASSFAAIRRAGVQNQIVLKRTEGAEPPGNGDHQFMPTIQCCPTGAHAHTGQRCLVPFLTVEYLGRGNRPQEGVVGAQGCAAGEDGHFCHQEPAVKPPPAGRPQVAVPQARRKLSQSRMTAGRCSL